ncbi:MAG: hypothetical protein M5U17_02285 [Ignavibacterium sp.]|nr:hypothetical protein [Ignavibacterium sp.]
MFNKPDKLLPLFLWLVSLHSLFVGAGLILLPTSAFEFLGFLQTFDRFFSTQGGVFHFAMSVAYGMATYNLIKNKQLVVFSVIVKFIAAVFLIIYFVFISRQWLIIASAITDMIMGIVILFLYKKLETGNYFN